MTVTTEQARQLRSFAAKMANVTTGLDRLQWLAILAAVEALTAEAVVELPFAAKMAEAAR